MLLKVSRLLLLSLFAVLTLSVHGVASMALVDIRSHGAVGDGKTLNTQAVQSAIDAVNRSGGGVVVVADGVYLTASIELRSEVTLRIEKGAILLGAKPEPGAYPVIELRETGADFPDRPHGGAAPPKMAALIFARGQRNIAVEGEGIIDGNGLAFPLEGHRPSIIGFVRCENVRVEDVTTRASAFWTQHYAQCRGVEINRVTVHSHLPDRNNDGIDFVECHQVRLANSTIIADDDAIVFKSNITMDHGSRDILVENCTIYGRKSAIKIGTETFGPFENITVRNLVCYGTRGINLYSVDGSRIRNVLVENVKIQDAYAALLLHIGTRRLYSSPLTGEQPPPGEMTDVTIRNLEVTFAAKSFHTILEEQGITLHGPAHQTVMPVAENFISGLPDHPITNVKLQNIILRGFPGGTTQAGVRHELSDNHAAYPMHGMFGALPAWGLYVRYANGVIIDNLIVSSIAPDARPVILADQVRNFKLGTAINESGDFGYVSRNPLGER